MKKMLTALLAAAVAGALFIAAPLTAAPPDTNHNNSDVTYAEGCGDGNELLIRAPENLWPPNHKYFEDIYARATGADGEKITVETRGVHDQYDEDTGIEQNGSGNTADDFTVSDEDAGFVQDSGDTSDPQIVAIEPGESSVQTDWRARAERSGRDQTGRTYTLQALAEFQDGMCDLTVQFLVPHDMRPSNR